MRRDSRVFIYTIIRTTVQFGHTHRDVQYIVYICTYVYGTKSLRHRTRMRYMFLFMYATLTLYHNETVDLNVSARASIRIRIDLYFYLSSSFSLSHHRPFCHRIRRHTSAKRIMSTNPHTRSTAFP